jgi:demethylmenaquinone methyltransferase/2-methoxy-6-polyprenyl-1,4-benzoquinol methylase
VRRLFSTIADRYDFITVALSCGQDRRWKRRLVSMAEPGSRRRALDLATGTGDLAFAIAAAGPVVVGLDITPRMIELARARSSAGRCAFVVGDMVALPFPSQAFDLVTTGYGLRNVADLAAAVREIARVLAPGGLALSLDFDRPPNWLVREAYLGYLTIVGSLFGWALHRDPDTYRYIPASIRRYAGSHAVARLLESSGFTDVKSVPVLGGLMAIHCARRTR